MLRERFRRISPLPGLGGLAPILAPALVLASLAGALAGCGIARPGNGEDLQVTYYYLPG